LSTGVFGRLNRSVTSVTRSRRRTAVGHAEVAAEHPAAAAMYARYAVVRKHPAEASFAEATDPHRH
jgi:hypothetical protein